MIARRVYPLHAGAQDLLSVLANEKGFFLLESSLRHPHRGRYSFIGYDPFLTLAGNDLRNFGRLRAAFDRYFKSYRHSPGFSCGIAGYLSYDLGLKFENIQSRHHTHAVPGFMFGFYDRIITVDHFRNTITVTSTGLPEKRPSLQKMLARQRLADFEQVLASVVPLARGIKPRAPARSWPRLHSNLSRGAYCAAVRKALAYIKRGDIYQVNLAQKYSTQVSNVDAAYLYRVLRGLSPSYYGGYFNARKFQIISSSPELFLHCRRGHLQTRPMKGTRARGRNILEDRRQARELQRSPKEKAELLMVTDLERNDLGRVCEFGSVQVQSVREIERFETVFQATSTVSGRLSRDRDGFDVLAATFPGGSVTGCPKIRAMQIIDELEPCGRGIYTGAMGYLAACGDMAFNILIRSMLVQEDRIDYYVGSGIVADSDPQKEYEETLIKARAMRRSLAVIHQQAGAADTGLRK